MLSLHPCPELSDLPSASPSCYGKGKQILKSSTTTLQLSGEKAATDLLLLADKAVLVCWEAYGGIIATTPRMISPPPQIAPSIKSVAPTTESFEVSSPRLGPASVVFIFQFCCFTSFAKSTSFSLFRGLFLSLALSLTLLSILAWSKKKFSTNLSHFDLASPICMFQNSIYYLKVCCLFIPASVTWQRHFRLLKFSLLSVFFQHIYSIKRRLSGCSDPCDSSKERCCSFCSNMLFPSSGMYSRESFFLCPVTVCICPWPWCTHRGYGGCGASNGLAFKPQAWQIKSSSRTALNCSNRAFLDMSCILPSKGKMCCAHWRHSS